MEQVGHGLMVSAWGFTILLGLVLCANFSLTTRAFIFKKQSVPIFMMKLMDLNSKFAKKIGIL